MNIRSCNLSDTKVICEIYNYYIENTTITFEQEPVSEEVMAKRIISYTDDYPWLVLETIMALLWAMRMQQNGKSVLLIKTPQK